MHTPIVNVLYSTGDNPCDSNECTHLCLLSVTDVRGYSCACPLGYEIDPDNENDCISKYIYTHDTVSLYNTVSLGQFVVIMISCATLTLYNFIFYLFILQ